MPTLKEKRLRLLPYNPIFDAEVREMRAKLGIPLTGVPSNLVELCGEWIKRRGIHPSGGFWPLTEYEEFATKPGLWEKKIIESAKGEDPEYFRGWLRGAIPAFGVPHHVIPFIRQFVIDNDKASFERACNQRRAPEINVEWGPDTGIAITLEDIDANTSLEDWKRIFDRVQPFLDKNRDNPLGVNSPPSRERRNFDRDLFLFIARSKGATIQEALDQWCEKHPEDLGKIGERAAGLAIDAVLDLMLPQQNWMADIRYERGTPQIKIADRDEIRRRIKQWLEDNAKQ